MTQPTFIPGAKDTYPPVGDWTVIEGKVNTPYLERGMQMTVRWSTFWESMSEYGYIRPVNEAVIPDADARFPTVDEVMRLIAFGATTMPGEKILDVTGTATGIEMKLGPDAEHFRVHTVEWPVMDALVTHVQELHDDTESLALDARGHLDAAVVDLRADLATLNGIAAAAAEVALDAAATAGLSAYDLAVEDGYTGTQVQWLASLVGPKGDKGDKGDQGPQGVKGDKGDTGSVAGLDAAIATEREYVDSLIQPGGNHGNIIAETIGLTFTPIVVDFPDPISGTVTVTVDVLGNLIGHQALVGYKFRGPNGEKALDGMSGLTYSSSIGEPYRYMTFGEEHLGKPYNWSYTATPDPGWTLDGLVIRAWNQGTGNVFVNGIYTDIGTPPKVVTRDLNGGIAVPVDPTSGASAVARRYVDDQIAAFGTPTVVGKAVLNAADAAAARAATGAAATVHNHPVSQLTTTGTASSTTYLRGDGSWVTPTNTTYSVPTQAEAEAGTATTGRAFSAQRVAQAIAAKAAPISHTHGTADVPAVMAAINARPAMFLWDGAGTYTVPANAVPGVDNVLNLDTGEIHTITA